MCGIAGYVSNKNNSSYILKKIVKELNHRGPDNNDVIISKGVGLGHTRLSIIDLNNESNQPFNSNDNRYSIVYNGEIYNYRPLRNELVSKGYEFRTNSDTEVVLNGFIEFGEGVCSKLNGMFAFAIYDHQDDAIFISRDRFGIKPLFYFHEDDDFWFCSEMRPLDNHITQEKNTEAAILMLLLGSIPSDLTINTHIKKLRSGHYGWLKNGNMDIKKYSDITYSPKKRESTKDIISNVYTLTTDAIKNSLISDAPIGTFLSGGLDSSIITAVSSKYLTKIKTISVTFDDKKYSEGYYQKLIVNRYKTEHYEYHVTKAVFQNEFLNYLNVVDQPNMDGFNTYLASNVAKEAGLKSVLAGQGADELFYGYETFLRAKKIRERRLPVFGVFFLKKLKELLYNKYSFKDIGIYFSNMDLSLYLPHKQIFSPIEISNILNVNINTVILIIINKFVYLDTKGILDYDDKVSYYEFKLYLESQLLAKDDAASMSHSLEVRIPFLDNDLVDYVTKLPSRYKYKKGTPKALLAKAFENDIPSEIIHRNKAGFGIPYGIWLKDIIYDLEFEHDIYINMFLNKRIGWTKLLTLVMLKKFHPTIELSGKI